MKNNKGITLVALLITIVVMLILAGVTLNLTLGEHGIFTTATKAIDATKLAQLKESLELSNLDLQTEYSLDKYVSGKDYNGLYDYIKDKCEHSPDKSYETDNGKYWIDDNGVLHYTDKETGSDATLVPDKDGNVIIKEVTIDGVTEDMTTVESIKSEVEGVVETLKKEYEESGSDKSFADWLKDKCEENGGTLTLENRSNNNRKLRWKLHIFRHKHTTK